MEKRERESCLSPPPAKRAFTEPTISSNDSTPEFDFDIFDQELDFESTKTRPEFDEILATSSSSTSSSSSSSSSSVDVYSGFDSMNASGSTGLPFVQRVVVKQSQDNANAMDQELPNVPKKAKLGKKKQSSLPAQRRKKAASSRRNLTRKAATASRNLMRRHNMSNSDLHDKDPEKGFVKYAFESMESVQLEENTPLFFSIAKDGSKLSTDCVVSQRCATFDAYLSAKDAVAPVALVGRFPRKRFNGEKGKFWDSWTSNINVHVHTDKSNKETPLKIAFDRAGRGPKYWSKPTQDNPFPTTLNRKKIRDDGVYIASRYIGFSKNDQVHYSDWKATVYYDAQGKATTRGKGVYGQCVYLLLPHTAQEVSAADLETIFGRFSDRLRAALDKKKGASAAIIPDPITTREAARKPKRTRKTPQPKAISMPMNMNMNVNANVKVNVKVSKPSMSIEIPTPAQFSAVMNVETVPVQKKTPNVNVKVNTNSLVMHDAFSVAAVDAFYAHRAQQHVAQFQQHLQQQQQQQQQEQSSQMIHQEQQQQSSQMMFSEIREPSTPHSETSSVFPDTESVHSEDTDAMLSNAIPTSPSSFDNSSFSSSFVEFQTNELFDQLTINEPVPLSSLDYELESFFNDDEFEFEM